MTFPASLPVGPRTEAGAFPVSAPIVAVAAAATSTTDFTEIDPSERNGR